MTQCSTPEEHSTPGPTLCRAVLDEQIVALGDPICSEALEEHGIGVDVEPERPKLGILIRNLAENARGLLELV